MTNKNEPKGAPEKGNSKKNNNEPTSMEAGNIWRRLFREALPELARADQALIYIDLRDERITKADMVEILRSVAAKARSASAATA